MVNKNQTQVSPIYEIFSYW